MPSAYNDAPSSCHLPRRHARSFDLDDSAAKAAAWVWHLHTSKPGITTEGQFIFPQSKIRRHSAGTFDQRASRFQQEASTATMAKQTVLLQAGKSKADHAQQQPMWDCGSSLYDTFELVAFGNSLDRSLMDAVPFTPPQADQPEELHPAHAQPEELHPWNTLSNVSASGISRATSLPRSLPSLRKSRDSTAISNRSGMDNLKLANSCNDGSTGMASRGPEKATTKRNPVAKFVSAMKKAVVLRTQTFDMGCKRRTNVIESSRYRPIIKNINSSNSVLERELTLNPEVIGSLTAANLSDSKDTDDRLSANNSLSFRYDYISDSRSNNYKLSDPMITKNKLDYGKNGSNQAGNMPIRRLRAVSIDALNGEYLSANLKIKPRSESFNGEHGEEVRSPGRRKQAEDGSINGSINDRSKKVRDCGFVWNGSKNGSTGAIIRGRINGATEHELSDLHKHLHHHHHHHHHHHYLHHNSMSEAARLRKEAMIGIPAEQKLTNDLAG